MRPPVQDTENSLVPMTAVLRLRHSAPFVLPSLSFSKHARLSHVLLTLNRLFPLTALLLSPKKGPFITQDPIQNVTSSILSFPGP